MAEDGTLMTKLLQYRFSGNGELDGHSLGNLILTALSDVTGGFDRAISAASRFLAIRGQVLPVTLEKVRLEARLENGDIIKGESNISKSPGRIQQVRLVSDKTPLPGPGVLEAIQKADAIILGPGSLFTSLIPTLLVAGIVGAIRRSPAKKICIANLMTQPGETTRFTLEDHLKSIEDHAEGPLFDNVLVNSELPSPAVVERYARVGAEIVADTHSPHLRGYHLRRAPLSSNEPQLRHDPVKLRLAFRQLLSASIPLAEERLVS
jgi:uncharacterized cofD-like protein